jgi:lysozyme family protein
LGGNVSRFGEALQFVLAQEGAGQAPGDVPTAWGVTQGVYDTWRQAHGLPSLDVHHADPSELSRLYDELYWGPARCEDLPAPLDLLHFDTAVNLGVGTAARMLQTALNLNAVDGIVGPRTIRAAADAAAQEADTKALSIVYARYCNLRVMRYITLAQSQPAKRAYLRGWLHRVSRLLAQV